MKADAPASADALVVIVAVPDGRAPVRDCLRSIVRQLGPGDRAIVVAAPRDAASELVQREFPTLSLLAVAPATLTPRRWQAGIAASSEPIVVLTTASCVPRAGWLAALRAGFAEPVVAGVGGAIEPGESLGMVDWAVYHQRYSGVRRPLPAGPVQDIAADNAAYRRAALAGTEALTATGFWEPFIHATLRRQGLRLAWAPAAVVTYRGGARVGAFCRQRFQHGRYFGALRARGASPLRRVVRAGTGPFIPPLLLGRIAARLWRLHRHSGWQAGREFARALPCLPLFLACWAAGEVAGTLFGAPGVGRGAPEPPGGV